LKPSIKYVLLSIDYEGYDKDFPTETKKFTGSSPSPKRVNIVDKVSEKGEQINLIQYALKKPISLEVSSKALGCSALYSCVNENKAIVLISEIMKKIFTKSTKPRWLGDYEIYLLSLKKELTKDEGFYILRTTGGLKYKEVLEKALEIKCLDLLEIHETRSVIHTGNKRIIRSIVGTILFVKTKKSCFKEISAKLADNIEIDIFEIEKIIDSSS